MTDECTAPDDRADQDHPHASSGGRISPTTLLEMLETAEGLSRLELRALADMLGRDRNSHEVCIRSAVAEGDQRLIAALESLSRRHASTRRYVGTMRAIAELAPEGAERAALRDCLRRAEYEAPTVAADAWSFATVVLDCLTSVERTLVD